MHAPKLPKIVLACIGQAIALVLLAGLLWLTKEVVQIPLGLLLIVQGGLAAVLSTRLGLPGWWRWIQFFFPSALYWALQLETDPVWALLAFIVLWLVFANASKERVPLYLTNATTRQALSELIKKKKQVHFMDLGCGLGGNVVFMASQNNVEQSVGVETAPLPYVLSALYTRLKGGQVLAQSLWKTDLSSHDVVYAFLSPEPMPKLWKKVHAEMKSGSVFVSNSFAVPGVSPSEVWQLADRRQTKLFIYRLCTETVDNFVD